MRRIYLRMVENRHHIAFLLFLFLSVRILFLNTAPPIEHIRSKASDTFAFLFAPWNYYQSLIGIKLENAYLREQNLKLRLEMEELLTLQDRVQQFQEALQFQKSSRLTLLPASVVATGTSPHLTSVLIDAGAADRVVKNLAVISSKGVIGKTIAVGAHSATVQLYSDMNFRLSVRIEPSGTTGILHWFGENEGEIREVRKNAPIKIGNRVVTSGFSRIFPKDLPVGTVIGVENVRGQYDKTVRVKMASELDNLSDVFVILPGDDE